MFVRYITLPHLILAFALAFLPDSLRADIAILPQQASLFGPEASQPLLILHTEDGESFRGSVDLKKAKLSSSRPDIIAITKDGVAQPRANGTATITARLGDQEATATLSVYDFQKPWTWSFKNHVLPVLSRNDCNTGGCHGALAGKGGFRLSLFGYDADMDYHTIARESRGRRVEPASPGHSLLLTKPTTAVKHKGGKRLELNTRDYDILADWIARGSTPPSAREPDLEHIEIYPDLSVLKKGQSQQLRVRAFYEDGTEEDVTSWIRFTSTDQTVADIDEHGKITVTGYGEGAITAWFSSRIITARISSPYPHKLDPKTFTDAPRRNFIDDLNLAQLERLNLKPSPRASDEVFVRRAYLDTIGKLPTPEETTSFLRDSRINKRDKLIEKLLDRPEFVDFWTYKWADIFLVSGNQLRPKAVEAYYKWIRARVEQEMPWDQMVREVVTAKGSSVENGATNFFAVHQDPETMAENVSQAFLSLSINCAKCHNHPLEKWTNDQYYGFANLFSRVRAKGWGGDKRNGDGIRTLYVEREGELLQPRTGKPQAPAPLDGAPITMDDPHDRREALAQWLTAPENPYFTRAIVNRVWAELLGVGLVESVDDLRVSNPASNDALLQATSDYLIEHEFRLKDLMQAILQSELYQRSGEPLPENKDETRFYTRYYPRRLMAEILSDAISDVTAVPDKFTETLRPDGSTEKTEFYPEGTRALQLYDSAVKNYFLTTFGRNAREITCDCERSDQPSMIQVLHLSNGDTINKKLQEKGSRISELFEMAKGDFQPKAIVNQAYLLCLSRQPSNRESEQFTRLLTAAPEAERRAAVEDLYWALMTSREFLFQH